MWFSYQIISDICHYQVANISVILSAVVVIFLLVVLLYTIRICKQRATHQLKVYIHDVQNVSMKDDMSLQELNSHDFIDNKQNMNRSVRIFAAYCAKSLVIVCILAVVASIPWEFIHLYQKALAGRASRIVQGTPSECNPEGMTLYESFKSLLRSQFSWMHATNPCQEYYNALLVDPLWEVTPVMVLSSVLARCFLHPLELVSTSLARSLRHFFSEIPIQWQPLFMLFAIMIICLVLLMLFRYRLSFPLIVRLEPTSPTHNLATMKSNSCTYKSKKKVSYNSNNKDSSSLRNIGSDRMFLCSQLTASNHNKLNNQNDSFSESYRNSWNMNSPKSSSYKHTVQLDNADKTALLHESQTQGLLLKDYWKSVSYAEPSIKQSSSSGIPNITRTSSLSRSTIDSMETNKVKKPPNRSQVTMIENFKVNRKHFNLTETQFKQRKRNIVVKRKTKLDTLWTPKSEDYSLSDSD